MTHLHPPIQTRTAPTHGPNWQNILSAPLEENLVPQFLEQFSLFLNDKHLPCPKHLQLLLHFASLPSTSTPKTSTVPTALSLLHQLVTLHRPSSFAGCLPRCATAGHDGWLVWEAVGESEGECRRRMRGCRGAGVWALVWEDQGRREGKRRRGGEDEGEGQENWRRSVSEAGWGLLGWLLRVWEDEENDSDSRGFSSMFLQQLPRPHSASATLQYDDASIPLAIARSALSPHHTPPHPASPGASLHLDRVDIARRLLILLLHAAHPTPSPTSTNRSPPPFHPASLQLSLLSLFRSLPFASFSHLLNLLASSPVPPHAIDHLLMLCVEDLAGVRQARSDARRRRAGDKDAGDVEAGSTYGAFPPPTTRYIQHDLLLLTPAQAKAHDTRAKMMFSKMMLVLRSFARDRGGWKGLVGGWRAQVESTLGGKGEGGGPESSGLDQSFRGVLGMLENCNRQ